MNVSNIPSARIALYLTMVIPCCAAWVTSSIILSTSTPDKESRPLNTFLDFHIAPCVDPHL